MSDLVFFLSRPLLVAPGGVLDTVYISTFLRSVHTFVTPAQFSRNSDGPLAGESARISDRTYKAQFSVGNAYGLIWPRIFPKSREPIGILYTVFCIPRGARVCGIFMQNLRFAMHFHRKCEQIAHKNKKNGGFLTKSTEKLTFYIKNDIIYGGNIPGYSILYPKYSIFRKNPVYSIIFCTFFVFCILYTTQTLAHYKNF